MKTALLVAGVLLATAVVADADADVIEPAELHPSLGIALDLQGLDFHGHTAAAMGGDLTSAFGHGRWQVIVEGGGAGLASGPAIGVLGDARVGARFLVSTFGPDDAEEGVMAMMLDAGVGGERLWLSGSAASEPYVFVGWSTSIPISKRSWVHLDLRISASPQLSDPESLTALCRGACESTYAPPADFAIKMLFGVARW